MRRCAKWIVRILAAWGVFVLVLMTAVIWWRLPLATWALRNALVDAGVTDVVARVTQLTPRRVEIQPLEFSVDGQRLRLGRVTMIRPAVFSRSLGRISLEDGAARIDLATPRPATVSPQTPAKPTAAAARPAPVSFDQIRVDGRLTLALGSASQIVAVDLEAKPAGGSRITFDARVTGPGLAAAGHGGYDLGRRGGQFTVENLRLDLGSFAGAFGPEAASVLGGWKISGTLTGTARVEFGPGRIVGDASLQLRDGASWQDASGVSVKGITSQATVSMGEKGGRSTLDVVAALKAPGLTASGHGVFDPELGTGDFVADRISVDLASWSGVAAALAPAATGYQLRGSADGSARARMKRGSWGIDAVVHVRDGAVQNRTKHVAIEGVATDLNVALLPRLKSAPGELLRVGQAQIGGVTLREGRITFQVMSGSKVEVDGASVRAFGGRLSAEPFAFDPHEASYAFALRADDVRLEEVLALFPDAPVKASGVVEGMVPLTIDDRGLHFGHGWIGLKAGQTTLVLFHSDGLLTGAVAPTSRAYASLHSIETGRTPLKVQELRVDLHPADRPAGRAAKVRIVGRPSEPGTDLGTLTLDLNLYGPLEDLMNWGLKTDISVSTGAK